MSEQAILSNGMGTITDKRVTYFRRSMGFGGTQVDLPVRHITSVRTGTNRSIGKGLVLTMLGLAGFASGSTGILIGLVLLAIAFILLWGFPTVVLNTAGVDKNISSTLPWRRAEAEAFAGAVRGQLFD